MFHTILQEFNFLAIFLGIIQTNWGNQNIHVRKNIFFSFFLKAGHMCRLRPCEPRHLITLINDFQLDNLVKRMGGSLGLSQTNDLCQASLCLLEGGALPVPGLMKRPRFNSRIISFHPLALWFLTVDLHFTLSPSSQIFHDDIPTAYLPPFNQVS